MNTGSLLVDEVNILDKLLMDNVGLNERHVADFRQIMFRKQLRKKEFLITEDVICNFIGIVISGTMRSFIHAAQTDELNNDFYFESHFVSA